MKSETQSTIDKSLYRTTFILDILSLGALILISIMLNLYGPKLLSDPSSYGMMPTLVFIGFLVILIFNIISFIWILHSIVLKKMIGGFDTIALVYCGLCILLMMGEKTMIDEIAREDQIGWETSGQLNILFALLVVQLLFNFLILGHLYRALSSHRQSTRPVFAFNEDTIFQIVHWIGATCGAIGLCFNIHFIRKGPATQNLAVLVTTYILILFPYGISVLYWLLMRIKQHFSEWYDEKQLQDISKAGFITLILSIPGMAGLFLIGESQTLLWFPHFLFLTLLLFSATTLYLNKFIA